MNSKELMLELDANISGDPCYKIDTQQLAYELCQELTRLVCSRKIRRHDFIGMASCVSSVNKIYLAFRKSAQKKYAMHPEVVGDDVLNERLFLSVLPRGYGVLSEAARILNESKLQGAPLCGCVRGQDFADAFIDAVLLGRYPMDS